MTATSDQLLQTLADLKAQALDYTEKLADVKTRRAVIQDKLDSLGDKLSDALGTTDWAAVENAIEKLSTAAQKATEALAETLAQAGIE